MAVSKLSSIVASSDMAGKYNLVFGSDTDRFDSFVIENEYKVLIDLFGAENYNKYVVDPSLTEWTNLLNGVAGFTDVNGYIRNWQGLKNMLIPYHYSTWILSNEFSQTKDSMIKNSNENSIPISSTQLQNFSFKAFNDFLKEYNMCFNYMYSLTSSILYVDFQEYFKKKYAKGFIVNTTVK
ncbi:MAG: hypothetical protein GY870_03940 [archaeon]|nr:hypothetical protein [archaeon]